jgi:hypothetical protein
MPDVPHDAVDRLAADQAGVLSRRQLADLGVTRHQIRDAVRARKWRLLGQVVVVHRGQLGPAARQWAAVLHLGPGAALAAWTAAEAGGLRGFPREAVHVIVPRGHRIRSLPWMKVHESRRLHEGDVRPAGLPTVGLARAVIDMAAWATTSRGACAALAAAVQQRLTTVDHLRTELQVAGRINRRGLIAATLNDIEGGSHALDEIDLVKLCRRYGLPKPERQRKRKDSSGRVRYLDAWLRRADGRIVHVEIDGAVHLTALNWWDDMDRQTDLAIAEDALVVRLASVSIRIDPRSAAQRLARALHLDPPQLRAA